MGKANDRQRQKKAQARREKQAKKRASAQKERRASKAAGGGGHDPDVVLDSIFGAAAEDPHDIPPAFDPPMPERLLPPVLVDRTGAVVPDPYKLLGLPPGTHDEAAIRKAWREAIIAHPPETDPEGSRRVREARDRLLDPERVIEREAGVLRAPSPAAWGLADEAVSRMADRDRLLGEMMLYALVEDELLRHGAL